jgi:hypothetical protein
VSGLVHSHRRGHPLAFGMRSAPVLVLLATATAAADDGAQVDPTRASFVMLDRQNATSRAGVSVSYSTAPQDGVTGYQLEPYGEYVDSDVRLGGYARLPIGYRPVTDLTTDSGSKAGIGALELGAIYAPLISPNYGVVLHAGIALPTGSMQFQSWPARVQDRALEWDDQTTLRLGASPVARWGPVFARADIGLDVALGNNGTGELIYNGNRTHVDLGFGVEHAGVTITSELASLRDPSIDGFPARWYVVGALAASYQRGRARPYAALILPIHVEEGTIATFPFAITVGAELSLH